MITIELTNVQVELGDRSSPSGPVKMLAFADPQSGVRVVVPLDARSARMIAAHLEGRPAIHVANGLPPEAK